MKPRTFGVWAAVAAGAAVLLMSCASDPTSRVVTGTPRPPIDPAQVKIYSSPPPKYEEIAILDTTSAGSGAMSEQAKTDVVMQQLREAAASLGANGVIVKGMSANGRSTSVGVGVGGGGGGTFGGISLFSTNRPKTARGTAIYVPTGAK